MCVKNIIVVVCLKIELMIQRNFYLESIAGPDHATCPPRVMGKFTTQISVCETPHPFNKNPALLPSL